MRSRTRTLNDNGGFVLAKGITGRFANSCILKAGFENLLVLCLAPPQKQLEYSFVGRRHLPLYYVLAAWATASELPV